MPYTTCPTCDLRILNALNEPRSVCPRCQTALARHTRPNANTDRRRIMGFAQTWLAALPRHGASRH